MIESSSDNPIILYIMLKQSLHLDSAITIHYVANAVQHILMKYFTLQVVAVKTHIGSISNNSHLKTTTQWLASQSKKLILTVDDSIWDRLKLDFSLGKDLFCLKDLESGTTETVLILWPDKFNNIPDYIKSLTNLSPN